MSAFLDASVIVAILGREPDRATHMEKLEARSGPIFVSAVVVFEAAIALARKKAGQGIRLTADDIHEARAAVTRFLSAINAKDVPLAMETGLSAINAVSRFGKHVGHPAGLNMGDAFAYACARAEGVALLYKGDDFSRTDIPTV